MWNLLDCSFLDGPLLCLSLSRGDQGSILKCIFILKTFLKKDLVDKRSKEPINYVASPRYNFDDRRNARVEASPTAWKSSFVTSDQHLFLKFHSLKIFSYWVDVVNPTYNFVVQQER